MADLFGDWVPSEWIEKVLQVIQKTPRHKYFLLTKYPKNLVKYQYPQWAWVGMTIDKQERVTGIEYLKQVTAVRYISFEPLLEPIDIDLYGIDWIIIGGCTGSRRFTPPKEWVDSLIGEARKHGIVVFLKENLGYPEVIQEWPEGPPCYHDEHDQPCSDYCPSTYQSCTIRDPENCEIVQKIESPDNQNDSYFGNHAKLSFSVNKSSKHQNLLTRWIK